MKKLSQLFLIMMMAVCVCVMAACSDGSDEGTGTGEIDTNRYVYREFDLNKGIDDIQCSYLKDNEFYYISYSMPDYESEDEAEWHRLHRIGRLHLYKTETGEDTVLCEIERSVEVTNLCVTEQNQIVLLYMSYDEDEDDYGRKTLVTITPDGTEVSSISLSDKMEAFLGEGSSTGYTEFEQDGYLYVKCTGDAGEEVIVRCDMEGNVTGSVPYDGGINGIFLDNEKKPAVAAHNEEGLEYVYMDFEKGECGEIHTIPNVEGQYRFGSATGYDYPIIYNGYGDVTCYIRDVDECLAYNEGEQRLTDLFDWSRAGIVGGFVDDLFMLEDGRMFCSCGHIDSQTYGFVEYLEEGKEKRLIKCAALKPDSDSSHLLEEKIINYNRSSSDYTVELVSYNKSANPIDGFAKDVIAGNIPDVLDISGVEVMSYINQGFFEDLAPYMEKDDEFGKDYYVDGLYDAIAVDGAQYYAIKYFGFATISAKASDTEQYKDGWTMKDMIDYYHSKPEGTMLCPHGTKNEVFDILAAPFIDDYIDWGTGKVSFDSDEFRELAAFCNEFPSNDQVDSITDYVEVSRQIREGKMLINSTSVNDSWMNNMQFNRTLFGDDFRCIGFPSADKKKAYITPESVSLAMTSSSEEKEAAWDFIKSVITDEEYDCDGDFPYIPSGKKQFEKYVKRITATEKYTNEDGRVIKPLDGGGGANGFMYTARPFTEEEVDVVRGLIKKSVIKFDNSTVLSLVESEMDNYFSGRKTLDDTISVLQDRIGKYVNENR